MQTALQLEGAPRRAEVSLVLVDDDFIRRLNLTYRQQDQPTDVLSFAQEEEPRAGECLLGDVVISVDTAARQAQEQGHPLGQELAMLAVHGTLHLLGWHDRTPRERSRMLARQAQVLAAAGEGGQGR